MQWLAALAMLLNSIGPDEWTEQGLREASEMFGVPYHELYRTAACESIQFRADVVYGPTRGAAGEQGIFQYLGGANHHLWRSGPWAAYSPYDPHAAAFTTAWWWAKNPATKYQWSCWRLIFG